MNSLSIPTPPLITTLRGTFVVISSNFRICQPAPPFVGPDINVLVDWALKKKLLLPAFCWVLLGGFVSSRSGLWSKRKRKLIGTKSVFSSYHRLSVSHITVMVDRALKISLSLSLSLLPSSARP